MPKEQKRFKTLARIVVCMTMVLCLAACDDGQRSHRIKLAHSLDTEHPVHKSISYMAARLAQISGGSLQVDIYPNGQLGSERELIELLQIGSLGMSKVSASPLEGFVSEMEIFSIPYVFRDHEHYWQVLNSDIGKKLLLAPERVGLRGLGYYDAGSRSFYSSERAIHSPADLAGMKIRVMKSQTAIKTVESLGGAATPISWGELYTALQQGVVDGAENNPPTFLISKHFEVSKYYTLDEHSSIPDMLLISGHVWKNLTTEQQGWLQQAVNESMQYQRNLWQQETEAALEAVAKAGIEIIRPDKGPFRRAVAPLHASYEGSATGALLKAIQATGHMQMAPLDPGSPQGEQE
ncbi:TRAP transporter substrate-binding protein [Paremcibacter congregatus]|uniref:TRAP transporter substrate-binding protein n=1 Tax=Paremcibacter congregatus TaxID=2043170 RepID=UPI003A90B365